MKDMRGFLINFYKANMQNWKPQLEHLILRETRINITIDIEWNYDININ